MEVGGRREAQEGGNIYIYISHDSRCCTAETNIYNTVKQLPSN